MGAPKALEMDRILQSLKSLSPMLPRHSHLSFANSCLSRGLLPFHPAAPPIAWPTVKMGYRYDNEALFILAINEAIWEAGEKTASQFRTDVASGRWVDTDSPDRPVQLIKEFHPQSRHLSLVPGYGIVQFTSSENRKPYGHDLLYFSMTAR